MDSTKRSTRRRWLRSAGMVALGLFLVAQLVPVDRANPPLGSEVAAPAHVLSVLRRSCYDCHSNETVWPWYSRIAPVSWLVARDVHEGRAAVNYSTWQRYSEEERAHHQEETWEEVQEGEMPLGIYSLAHPGARLSAEDVAALRAWGAEAAGGDEDGGAHR